MTDIIAILLIVFAGVVLLIWANRAAHRPKILILGEGRTGKDTFAQFFADATGLTFSSSSLAALDVIWPVLARVTGARSKHEAFERRAQVRELWRDLIALYCAADPTALARKVLQGSDIYVGMRSDIEFKASRRLFDHIIYVHRPGTMHDPSMGIKMDINMIPIHNSGSLHDLEQEAVRLAKYLGLYKPVND